MRTSASLFDGDGLQLDHARVELVDMEAVTTVLPRGGALLRDVLVDAVDVALDAADLLVELLELLLKASMFFFGVTSLFANVPDLHEDFALRVGLAAGRSLVDALHDGLDPVTFRFHDLEVVLHMVVEVGLQLFLARQVAAELIGEPVQLDVELVDRLLDLRHLSIRVVGGDKV